MNLDQNIKIFIQTNPQQELAAKVSKYSFNKFGFNNIELLKLNNVEILKKNFGKKYYRNGKLVEFDPSDLQSFTLLRFLPPKLVKDDYCLVIDPDIFAISSLSTINKYIMDDNFKIFCTKKKSLFRSEVMLINCKKNFKLWDFDQLINEIFSKKIDYNELINLKFIDEKMIGILEPSFNSLDEINTDTILLHTSNRITQPWKQGLDIDFTTYSSKFNYFKTIIRRLLGLKFNNTILQKKYQPHPDYKVNNFILNIFREAYDNNYINDSDIESSLTNKYLSSIFWQKFNG